MLGYKTKLRKAIIKSNILKDRKNKRPFNIDDKEKELANIFRTLLYNKETKYFNDSSLNNFGLKGTVNGHKYLISIEDNTMSIANTIYFNKDILTNETLGFIKYMFKRKLDKDFNQFEEDVYNRNIELIKKI
jgi:hypothetical protein